MRGWDLQPSKGAVGGIHDTKESVYYYLLPDVDKDKFDIAVKASHNFYTYEVQFVILIIMYFFNILIYFIIGVS